MTDRPAGIFEQRQRPAYSDVVDIPAWGEPDGLGKMTGQKRSMGPELRGEAIHIEVGLGILVLNPLEAGVHESAGSIGGGVQLRAPGAPGENFIGGDRGPVFSRGGGVLDLLFELVEEFDGAASGIGGFEGAKSKGLDDFGRQGAIDGQPAEGPGFGVRTPFDSRPGRVHGEVIFPYHTGPGVGFQTDLP